MNKVLNEHQQHEEEHEEETIPDENNGHEENQQESNPEHEGNEDHNLEHQEEEGDENAHEGHDNTHHDTEGEKDGEQHHNSENEHQTHGHEEHGGNLQPDDPQFWISAAMAAFLVCFAGICSGLTVGYLSIDDLALEIKLETGTERDIQAAKKIIPILKNHHILLCTLLLSNAIAMEALPIFLDAIMPAYMAIIFSTVAVVVVGEIIPQAYCTGPDQLFIAEKMAPLINVLIKVMYCFTYPIAKTLDKLLGIHGKKRFNNEEMKNLVSLYESLIPKCLNCLISVQKQNIAEGKDFKCKKCEQDKVREKTYFHCENKCYGQIICQSCYESNVILYETEVKAFKSVLENIEADDNEGNDNNEEKQEKKQQKLISERPGFVPIKKVVMVNTTDKIDKKSIKKITEKMYSQILVKDQKINDLVGFVKTKNLIQYFDQDTDIEFIERMYSKIAFVNDDDNFLSLIDKFKNNNAHIAVVLSSKGQKSRANSLTEDKQQSQDNLIEEENKIDVTAYSSLAPFDRHKNLKKGRKQPININLNSNELEHDGQKIIGIFTLKDVFENLVDVDFGESNDQDQIFKKQFEEAKNQDIVEQATKQNSKSILSIMGSNKNANRMKQAVMRMKQQGQINN